MTDQPNPWGAPPVDPSLPPAQHAGLLPDPAGYPPPGYPPGYGYQRPASATTNGLAIASLVLGIVWVWWIGSVLALVFGYVALSQIKRTGQQGKGMAIAGVVLGWVGVATMVLFFGIFAFGVSHSSVGNTACITSDGSPC